MKKGLVLLAAAMCLAACNKEKALEDLDLNFGNINVNELTNVDIQTIEYYDNFISEITATNDLSQEETDYINSKLQELKKDTSEGYKKISISYPSVDAQGKEVILSGAIYMPKMCGKIKELYLYCHQTSTSNDDVPSGTASMCMEPSFVGGSLNKVCFASDYLGFNASAQYNHPYMNNALAARNEIDMLKAGIVYLMNKGYKFATPSQGLKTYAFGYSQGGGVALAVHKAMEQDKQLCEDLNFRGTLCGDGPYNLRTTFQMFIDQGEMALPIVLPYVLNGMYESYPEMFAGIDIYDYMTPKCKEAGIIEYLCSKPSIMDVASWVPDNVGSNVSDIMSTEALDMNSSLMKTLFAALDKQNLLDGSWTPVHPITFYHSENDDIVSYENTREALQVFPSDVCKRSSDEINKGHIIEFVNFAFKCVHKGVPEMIEN